MPAKRRRESRVYCSVKSCGNNSINSNISFFRFPKDPKRCLIWLENCERMDLAKFTPEHVHNNYRICDVHFADNMFAGLVGYLSRKKLKHTAIPAIKNVPQDIVLKEQASGSILTPLSPLYHCEPEQGTSEMSNQSVEQRGECSTEELAAGSVLTPLFPLHYCEPEQGTSGIADQSLEQREECSIEDTGTQTPLSLSWDSPRKHELRLKIKKLSMRRRDNQDRQEPHLKRQKVNKEDIFTYLRKHFNKGLLTFLETTFNLHDRDPNGYRYSQEFKQFALTVYFLGPNVYSYLATMFNMPSKTTLYRITRNWDITPGFNDFIFSVVETRICNMSEIERHCSLCMDEMSIKKNFFYNRKKDCIVGFHETTSEKKFIPAKSVFVIMARGIFSNWKQPLLYFFVDTIGGNEISKILHETISRLNNINMNVDAVVSDQGSNFLQFVRMQNICPEKPYFIVNEKRIFYFFDAPHLLKSTRTNLFKYKFVFNDSSAEKEHIVQFYNRDKNLVLRLAPKLTDDHIYPNSFKKMRVKLAAQVLSATVAAALNTYIALNALPAEAYGTANFIDEIDRLFDTFNSSKIHNSKEFNKPFTGAEKQVNFLNKMYNKFCNTRIMDKNKDITSSIKFVKGWKLSIKALIGLHESLSCTYNTIYTRRLNQDSLENFFGTLRQQGGNARNPTPTQVNQGFKKLFCLSYFRHSEKGNCVEDFDKLLGSVTEENILKNTKIVKGNAKFVNLDIGQADYINIDMPTKNALSYISGYLLKKCLEKHQCDMCIEYSKKHTHLSEDVLFSFFKAYETKDRDSFGNLLMPPEHFVEYLFELEKIFAENFEKCAIENNVGINIKNLYVPVNPHPCNEFPQDFLLSLYTRLKIYYTIKYTNRDFIHQKPSVSQKLKNVKNL